MKNKLELKCFHLRAAAQVLQRPAELVSMAKTKEDALQAPKKGRNKGAMHAAGVATASIKAAAALQRKRQSHLTMSDEQGCNKLEECERDEKGEE